MKKIPEKFRPLIRLFSILFAIAGLLTLIPFPGASEPSIIGYKALCPFTPVSTLISL